MDNKDDWQEFTLILPSDFMLTPMKEDGFKTYTYIRLKILNIADQSSLYNSDNDWQLTISRLHIDLIGTLWNNENRICSRAGESRWCEC